MKTNTDTIKGQVSRINDLLLNIHYIKVVKFANVYRVQIDGIEEYSAKEAESVITYLSGLEKALEVTQLNEE